MPLFVAVLFLVSSAFAFVPHAQPSFGGSTLLFMSTSPPEDFLKRSQQVKSVLEDDEPPPKLFEDDLLEDMRQSLLLLEKRVKEGPGSLSVQEVDDFEAATQRILKEMKEFNASGDSSPAPPPAPVVPRPAATGSYTVDDPHPAAVLRAKLKHDAESKQKKEVVDDLTPAAALRNRSSGLKPGDAKVQKNKQVTDKSLDEGPEYDGTGGMGLAKGTANTYIIPGMDEMSPEEYRKALQKSVSDRQTRRHKSRGGVVGNRAALEYLDNLGWGGASSNWKKNEEKKNEENDANDDSHYG